MAAKRVGVRRDAGKPQPELFGKEFHQKAQSAMEYLMTYGWAILIIAVVLGALFQLGIFNASNFAPRAQAGSCQVVKNAEAGGVTVASLEGLCNGQLPGYVMQDNGQCCSSYVSVPASSASMPSADFSISAWVYTNPTTNWGTIFETNAFDFEKQGSNGVILRFIWGNGNLNTNTGIPNNVWTSVIVTRSGGFGYLYINGAPVLSGVTVGANIIAINGIRIGAAGLSGLGGIDTWWGSLANIQFYNASLSATEANATYSGGIGGAPVRPQNLVGWWPLNGNANDYSGNNNNGAATSVTYTSAWTNQYSGPV